MWDDLGEALVQLIAIESQIELILIGQLSKHIGLVLPGDIQERFELVGVIRSIENHQFEPDQGRCGHLYELPTADHRLIRKAFDIGVRSVANVDYAPA